mmetsp:Transcript_24825/g.98561  ORF Transcript_24825/g.98561 Transcript_24825/m.98561 type:complete len:123 (+) Transcript_24825:730-1098(+)
MSLCFLGTFDAVASGVVVGGAGASVFAEDDSAGAAGVAGVVGAAGGVPAVSFAVFEGVAGGAPGVVDGGGGAVVDFPGVDGGAGRGPGEATPAASGAAPSEPAAGARPHMTQWRAPRALARG